MYSFHSRIRYSEVDKKKQLDMASIINYFQDCSTFQSEDLGIGVKYLEDKNRAWLMNAWQIVVSRFPALGENITVGTWAYGFKGMYGYRNFILKDEKDEVCAAANSIWIFVDTENGRPCRLCPEDVKPYGEEEKYPMEYASRKIAIPEPLSAYPSFAVVSSNIDTNNHVNNGQYIKMAEDYLPDGFLIGQMRAEYRKSAVLGDLIIPKVYTSSELCTVVLSGRENEVFAVIEFLRKNGEKI